MGAQSLATGMLLFLSGAGVAREGWIARGTLDKVRYEKNVVFVKTEGGNVLGPLVPGKSVRLVGPNGAEICDLRAVRRSGDVVLQGCLVEIVFRPPGKARILWEVRVILVIS